MHGEQTDLYLEEPNVVINFLVAHLDLPRRIEGGDVCVANLGLLLRAAPECTN